MDSIYREACLTNPLDLHAALLEKRGRRDLFCPENALMPLLDACFDHYKSLRKREHKKEVKEYLRANLASFLKDPHPREALKPVRAKGDPFAFLLECTYQASRRDLCLYPHIHVESRNLDVLVQAPDLDLQTLHIKDSLAWSIPARDFPQIWSQVREVLAFHQPIQDLNIFESVLESYRGGIFIYILPTSLYNHMVSPASGETLYIGLPQLRTVHSSVRLDYKGRYRHIKLEPFSSALLHWYMFSVPQLAFELSKDLREGLLGDSLDKITLQVTKYVARHLLYGS